MTEKRYQYIGRDGVIVWTPWMPHTGDKPLYQLGRKLRNEYREVKLSWSEGNGSMFDSV